MKDRWRRADAILLRAVDEAWREAACLGGDGLACRRGCTECCLGPFPVTSLDGARLRRGLAALRRERPARAAALVRRAAGAVRTMSAGFPGDAATGRLDDDDTRIDRFLDRHRDLPCPALDPVAGTCELYAARPVTCRTYGPPVRLGGEDLPPCRLCFVGAAPDRIEVCRVEPDPDGIEDGILDAMEEAGEGDGDTVIAWVLARRAGSPRRPRGSGSRDR